MDKPVIHFTLTPARNPFRERRLRWLARVGVGLLAFAALAPLAFGDDVVPQGHKPDRYARVWQKSPFTVASVVAQPAATETGLADAYTLVGLATAGGKPIVTLLDNASQQSQLVTDKIKQEGDIRVVKFVNDIDPAKVEVTLQKGGETGVLKFNLNTSVAAPSFVGEGGQPPPNLPNPPRPPNIPAPIAPNIVRRQPPVIPRPQQPANIIRRPTTLPGADRRQRATQNQRVPQRNTPVPAPRPD
ncbi:MAG TPA: hypothetical protein VIT91_05800 [Chthoniobacterales bacterium]